jgi:hypothetical protein
MTDLEGMKSRPAKTIADMRLVLIAARRCSFFIFIPSFLKNPGKV